MAKTTRKTDIAAAEPKRRAVRRKIETGVQTKKASSEKASSTTAASETASSETASSKTAASKAAASKTAKPATTRRRTATAARPSKARIAKAVTAVANDRAGAVLTAEAVTPAAVTTEMDTASASRNRGEPTYGEVAERAYHIYLRRHGYPGNPEHDWLQAIEELRAERLSAASH